MCHSNHGGGQVLDVMRTTTAHRRIVNGPSSCYFNMCQKCLQKLSTLNEKGTKNGRHVGATTTTYVRSESTAGLFYHSTIFIDFPSFILFMIMVSNENIANKMGSLRLPQYYGSPLSLPMSSIASLVFLKQAAMPCQQCVATAASFWRICTTRPNGTICCCVDGDEEERSLEW